MEDTYDQLLLYSKQVSEDICKTSLELIEKLPSVIHMTIYFTEDKIVLSSPRLFKKFPYSHSDLSKVCQYLSSILTPINKIIFYPSYDIYSIHTDLFEIRRESDGIYILRDLITDTQREVAPFHLEKLFDLVVNIFLTSKILINSEKSKLASTGKGFSPSFKQPLPDPLSNSIFNS